MEVACCESFYSTRVIQRVQLLSRGMKIMYGVDG